MTRTDLPMPVVDLLVAAEKAGFEVLWNARQNISMRYGDRVSRYGWNTGRNGNPVHWYIRSSALGHHPISLLRDHGFEVERHGEVWTRLAGDDIGAATEDFRSAIEVLTGVWIGVAVREISASSCVDTQPEARAVGWRRAKR